MIKLLLLMIMIKIISSYNITTYNISTSSCEYSATCSVEGNQGVCNSISSGCCSGGKIYDNLCPGDNDIKCCVAPICQTSVGSGQCIQTSLCSSKGGKSVPGACSGPDDLQCCVNVTPETHCGTPYGDGTCMDTSLCTGNSISGYCPGADNIKCCLQGGGDGISRNTIMSRAQVWVDEAVPYSQTDYHDGYRQDCSGYVSYCWETGVSYVTQQFPNICTQISKEELKLG